VTSLDDAALSGSLTALAARPLIRYSSLSSMGQRIERQLARLGLSLANTIEVDSTSQQLSAVAAGVGWSITTPLCVASQLGLLPALHLSGMPQGGFARHIQIVARLGELGDLPAQIAKAAIDILSGGRLAKLQGALPWTQSTLRWPNAVAPLDA